MANDLNRVILIGRLTRDPELRYTPSGTAVSSFSIANNRTYVTNNEKKEQVSFFNCVAWAKTGEVIVQYCKKGQRIGIEGRLQQRSWDDQDGKKRSAVEVVVDNFQFLTPKGEVTGDTSYDTPAPSGSMPGPSGSMPGPPESNGNNPFSDDDIPF